VLDETADFVVMNVAGQLVRQLQLADCRLELEFHDERIVPNVDRSGSVWWGANQWDTQRWGLPPWGVAVPVWGHGRQLGRFLQPRPLPPVPPITLPTHPWTYRFKNRVLGRPLDTEQLIHERLGKPTALAVFASDNLSSSAYATEEILRVLIPAVGVAAFSLVV